MVGWGRAAWVGWGAGEGEREAAAGGKAGEMAKAVTAAVAMEREVAGRVVAADVVREAMAGEVPVLEGMVKVRAAQAG